MPDLTQPESDREHDAQIVAVVRLAPGFTTYRYRCSCGAVGDQHPSRDAAIDEADGHLLSLEGSLR